MQDIRGFFSVKTSKKKSDAVVPVEKKKGRKVILDSDEDEPVKTPKSEKKSRKRGLDEDDKTPKQQSKKSPTSVSKHFRPVDSSKVKSLFGTEPVKRVAAPQPKIEQKTEHDWLDDDDAWAEFQDDADDLVQKALTPVVPKRKLDSQESTSSAVSEETASQPFHHTPKSTKKEHKKQKNHEAESPKPSQSSSKRVVSSPVTPKSTNEKWSAAPTVSPKPITPTRCLPQAKTQSPNEKLWVDKYAPLTLKNIIGQQGEKSNVNKLLFWLKNWHKNLSSGKKSAKPNSWAKDDSGASFKAALLSGPPGVGKTTSAHLACKELGFDVIEFNASNTRSKRLLKEEISELLMSRSISNFNSQSSGFAHHVLVMDEVDGMAGNEDRGGIQELLSLIKSSKIPIICMCNDRHHPKIRSLGNYCFDLKFQRPRVDQIKGAMMSICFKEGLKIKPDVLTGIITTTNQDIRLVLNHLSMLAARKDSEMGITQKDVKLGAWDVLRKVFSDSERKGLTIHEQSDLFFNDYGIAPLFVQENYLNVVPVSDKSKTKSGKMKLFAAAATCLSQGDLVDSAIRSSGAWSLLPTQAILSSVLPGYLLSGRVGGLINFPAWLGKNSRKNKMERFAQEIQAHTRLKCSCDVEAVKLDYAKALRDHIARPLVTEGIDGVSQALDIMRHYTLLRTDLESLSEIATWPGSVNPMNNVETKVKAALTRLYNKSPIVTPFSIAVAKKGKGGQEGEEGEEEEEVLTSDDEDLSKDAMITVKKKEKPKKQPVATSVRESKPKGKKKK